MGRGSGCGVIGTSIVGEVVVTFFAIKTLTYGKKTDLSSFGLGLIKRQ